MQWLESVLTHNRNLSAVFEAVFEAGRRNGARSGS